MMEIFDSAISKLAMKRSLNLFAFMQCYFLWVEIEILELKIDYSKISYIAFWIHQVSRHVIADEEALSLHDNVGRRLMIDATIRGPDRNRLTRFNFDSAMELEKCFVFSAAADQLPTSNLRFLQIVKLIKYFDCFQLDFLTLLPRFRSFTNFPPTSTSLISTSPLADELTLKFDCSSSSKTVRLRFPARDGVRN